MSVLRVSNTFDTSILSSFDFSHSHVFLVKTLWNKKYIDVLSNDCIRVLKKYHVGGIHSFSAVGCIELVHNIKTLYKENKIHFFNNPNVLTIIISLGAIIKGGTPHFDFVCKYVTEGILRLNCTLQTPTIFGVLTVDNIKQLEERVFGNNEMMPKGKEFALTALTTLIHLQDIKG